MITVIDYHKGNIRSVVRGLEGAGAEVLVTDAPEDVARASAIVLPGVGAFKDAMDSLDGLGLTAPLLQATDNGVPFLGICLGMHALFEGGMEHSVDGMPRAGLGILPGIVEALPKEGYGPDGELQRFKLPHVGWNTVQLTDEALPLFDGIDDGEYFYFTHSFASPASPFTVGETTHSIPFPSAVRRGDVWGVQFHPEKSSGAGARMLANFVNAYDQKG